MNDTRVDSASKLATAHWGRFPETLPDDVRNELVEGDPCADCIQNEDWYHPIDCAIGCPRDEAQPLAQADARNAYIQTLNTLPSCSEAQTSSNILTNSSGSSYVYSPIVDGAFKPMAWGTHPTTRLEAYEPMDVPRMLGPGYEIYQVIVPLYQAVWANGDDTYRLLYKDIDDNVWISKLSYSCDGVCDALDRMEAQGYLVLADYDDVTNPDAIDPDVWGWVSLC